MKSAKYMNKIWKRVMPVLLSVLMFIPLLSGTVQAAEVTGSATIPIAQTLTGTTGSFTYTLSPKTDEGDQNHPMPADNSVTLTNTQSGSITVESSRPGTWYYILSIRKSSDSRYSYDVTQYRVGVKFYNDNGVLKSEVNAQAIEPQGKFKASSVHFHIAFRGGKKGTSGKTTTTPGSTTPAKHTGKTGARKVKTGDTSAIGLYLGMLIGAGALLVILAAVRRRRNDEASQA